MFVPRTFLAPSILIYTVILWIQPQTVQAQTAAPALIRDLQYWNEDDSTHIEIEMDGEAGYEGERISNPARIFFDISAARLGRDFRDRTVVVDNELLKRIRVAQNQPDVVRVVFDISAVRDYSVRKLQNPNRMIVDLYGQSGRGSDPELEATESGLQETEMEVYTETALNSVESAGVEPEVLDEPESDSGVESSQVVDLEKQIDKPSEMVVSEVEETRNGPALIRGLQYWNGSDSTHIEIEMDGEAEYEGERISNPDRIFFDISAARLGAGFGNRTVVVDNELLKRIRVAQNRPDVVRMVFDISAVGDYSVRRLQNPTRMVVELYGQSGRGSDPELEATESGLHETEMEVYTETALNSVESAGVEPEVLPEPEADSGVESSQVVDLEEQIDKPAEIVASEVLPEIESDSGAESSQVIDLEEQIDKPAEMVVSEVEETWNGPAMIRDLQYWSGSDSTHVEIEMDGEAEYEGERISNPDRIFFDISAARLGAGFGNRTVVVDNELLKGVRVAQNRPDVVRVVFDISAVRDYSVRKLQNPNRMVVDLYGHSGGGSDPELEATESGLQEQETKVNTETALNSEVLPVPVSDSGVESSQVVDLEEQIDKPAEIVASEVLPEPEADSGIPSTQVVDLGEISISQQATGNGSYMPDGAMQLSASPSLNVDSSQLSANNQIVAKPPKPIPRSSVQSTGVPFMISKPFTISGVLSTGYYSSYTRGGGNDAQKINFVPASAKFNVNGYFLTPDLLDYSFQPELNAGPQASDAGFQGGNGIRMRVNTLRRQLMPITFRYSNVGMEDVYFGNLSQLSSYTLNNRTRDLGLTTQLKLSGLPTATMDWGTTSVLSRSFIPQIPDYVSESEHRNVDLSYQLWGWDFRGFASRQQQISNLYMPEGDETNSSILHQKLKQYRGSARWSLFKDLDLSLDAGGQETSNFLLNRPINLTSRYMNMNLRLFHRRRWKTSLRAGYTSNISDLLLTGLVGDLSGSGSIAPDDSVLLPIQHTTSSLNLGGFTSVDLSHGLSLYASTDRTEVTPADNRDLSSRYLTTTGGMAYSGIFNWGNISGQYGRSYGNGSVTGQRGRIDGQNYVATIQPGKWEALQLDFSVRGTDQKIVNELPVHQNSLAFDGNVGFRLFGGFRTRIGGGWQKSALTNADSSFKTEGYTARAAIEHPRFQLSGSLNSIMSNSLQAYDQMFSEIGIGSTLLTPIHFTPSNFRGITFSLYAVPIRMLEFSALYTRSIQHLDGVAGNNFETIDASAKLQFRKLKFKAGFFRSGQTYSSGLTTYPETERGRFYISISRTFKF